MTPHPHPIVYTLTHAERTLAAQYQLALEDARRKANARELSKKQAAYRRAIERALEAIA
jgi:hypothetical protein